jgi:hypothetical protein
MQSCAFATENPPDPALQREIFSDHQFDVKANKLSVRSTANLNSISASYRKATTELEV